MNNNDQDYYEELGILREALNDAYRRLTMKWHPDHNISPAAG